ncbi:hypothetical protein U1Q18_026118 [Sarracenia purpurea var. burkii]
MLVVGGLCKIGMVREIGGGLVEKPAAIICGSSFGLLLWFLLIWPGPPILVAFAFTGFGHVSVVLLTGLFGCLHFPWSAGVAFSWLLGLSGFVVF